MAHVAFLGLGAMGSRMAERLLLAGHKLTVYNRTASRADGLVARGATLAETARDAVNGADVVVSIVTDDEAAHTLWMHPEHGAMQGVSASTLVLESSTVTPAWVEELAQGLGQRGAFLLDAPVAGSTPQAEAGALVFLVGGKEEHVERAREVMEAIGSKILHVGEQGHGAKFKLAVNALFATQVALVAELLVMLEGQGVDPEMASELLGLMPVTSPAAKGVMGLMIKQDHAPRFPVDLVAKDLRYAGSLGALPVTQAACAMFEDASRHGDGAKNLGVVHLHMKRVSEH